MIDITRHIKFTKEIDPESIAELLSEIEVLYEGGTDPIYISICSPGGEVAAALWFVDFVKALECEVIGVASGRCYSAAVLMLAGCDQRLTYESTHFMVHPMFQDTQLSSDTVRDVIKQFRLINKILMKQERPAFRNISDKKYLKMISKETYFTAPQALKYGFVDDIIGINTI